MTAPRRDGGGLFAFQGPLIADGAMGTQLLPYAPNPAELNLSQPELVRNLHAAYLRSGANVLVTNTLAAHQLGADAAAAAIAGVTLATQAATLEGNPAPIILGSLPALPDLSEQTYRELAGALDTADALLFETVTSLSALHRAIDIVRKVTSLPLAATFSFDSDGLVEGRSPSLIVAEVPELAALGYGCGLGLEPSIGILQEMRSAGPEAVLIAKPSLGLPPYHVTDRQLTAWARKVVSVSVSLVGLCCGSAPEHIATLRSALVQ